MTTIIIPCAGYGRRMGSPPAKELLPHPIKDRPFIEVAIERFRGQSHRTVVVTRQDKMELRRWCANKGVEVLLIEETREWPDSVLASKECWGDHNLLLLPDTDFSPSFAASLALELLKDKDACFACFQPPDLEKWGLIIEQKNGLLIADKPKNTLAGARAWGLIAFRGHIGTHLFSAIAKANREKTWEFVDLQTTTLSLDWFSDLTRPQDTHSASPSL